MAGPSVLEVAAGQLVHVRELTVPARVRANRDITTHVSNTFVTSHPAGRVLLLEGFDPAEPGSSFWFTIGGGLDEGEHSAQAALRELREEAGIVAAGDQLTGPVWRRSTQFSFDGTWYQQEEDYYLLRVGHVPVSRAGLDDMERRTVTGYRWWSHEELAATTDTFYPSELPDLLRRMASPEVQPGG
jgi:8-oxo-dGTP pyrophosphatase MutT (NUDIX family)